ncbi:MAG: hypothetical protein GXO20_01575 [Thermodesulfobacteria bacterium]|nr:hypothetical protein [Thermodesulfobacteriota bacterium]
MRLAILSQRGGVGKTTIALALAEFWGASLYELELGFPKLWPSEPEDLEPVNWRLSRFDRRKCDLCEECVKNCQFGALVREGEVIKHRGHRCRGCGLCKEICPRRAILLKEVKLGEIAKETKGWGPIYAARFVRGGAVEGVLWRRLYEKYPFEEKTILKAPTGLNGESLQAVKEAEFFVLLTTPDASGEIPLFAEIMQGIGLPGAVLLNFSTERGEEIRAQAESSGLFWAGEVPPLDDLSRGLREAYPAIESVFSNLIQGGWGG